MSTKTQSKTLSAVAAAIRVSGTKEKIIQLVDQNVAELKQQKADEVAQKDECVGTFQRIETDTHNANEDKKGFEADIALFENQIEKADADIASLQEENDQLKISMLEAGEDREEENTVEEKIHKKIFEG